MSERTFLPAGESYLTSVLYRAPVDMGSLSPDCSAIIDWLEEDGFEGYYFLDSHSSYNTIGKRVYVDVSVLFSNPAAAFNFRMRWT
jgi:hypothetical protein